MKKSENHGKQPLGLDDSMEQLEIGGVIYSTQLTKKFKNRVTWERPDENKINSVIPGTIQKVFVKEGDSVLAGDALLILEAMKMRNEVMSPFSGKIKKINIVEGEQVPKNHLMVEFE